jgi:transcriptional regulator with XRE-family HTH domain
MQTPMNTDTDGDTPGGRIWQARGTLNLTIEDLARRIGVSEQAVSDWERDRSAPDGAMLDRLARHLHVTPDWLTGGTAPSAADGLEALRRDLAVAQALHAETGRALQALEITLRRVLQE